MNTMYLAVFHSFVHSGVKNDYAYDYVTGHEGVMGVSCSPVNTTFMGNGWLTFTSGFV